MKNNTKGLGNFSDGDRVKLVAYPDEARNGYIGTISGPRPRDDWPWAFTAEGTGWKSPVSAREIQAYSDEEEMPYAGQVFVLPAGVSAQDVLVTGYPDNNPKTAIGVTKVPLHLVPPSAKHFLALALADGASKYGAYNWRDHAISVSVYKAAAERHMDAFWDGEDNAPDSGIHHIAHAMACMALILDAQTIGKLNDDRPAKGASPELQKEYATKGKSNESGAI